jgi:hypothetical protein
VVGFTLPPLYPKGKNARYALDRRLVGPKKSRSRRGDVEKNSQPLMGLESPIIHLAAQRCTTDLSRLLYN